MPEDIYYFEGPGTYFPKIEEETFGKIVNSQIMSINSAFLLSAYKDHVDQLGIKRVAGDKWLYREKGLFMEMLEQKNEGLRQAIPITDT